MVLFLFNKVIYVFLLYHCMFMYDYPDWGFSVLFPQLQDKWQGDARKDGARPALFLIFCCSMHFLCCSMHFCVALCIFVLLYAFCMLLYVFVLCCSMWCLFCDVPCIVCVYMCTEQLPPCGYSIAVKYIISHKYIILHKYIISRNTLYA
jgi:hypothetical protein